MEISLKTSADYHCEIRRQKMSEKIMTTKPYTYTYEDNTLYFSHFTDVYEIRTWRKAGKSSAFLYLRFANFFFKQKK